MAYFSVLVPACNMEGKMQKCIDSLLNQTYTDYEVIMVDDGSKDNTWEMLGEYVKADSRFYRFQHEENKSLLAARYTGMEHAGGQYIFFLDSDDYLEPDTLQSVYDYVQQNPVDVIRFGFTYEPGEDVPPYKTDNPLKAYLNSDMPPAIWKNCYSRKVIDRTLERTSGFYCNMGEDTFLAGVLFTNADSFGEIDRIFHHYVLGNGMSNVKVVPIAKVERDLKSIIASATHLMEFIDKYNPDYSNLTRHAVRTMYRFILYQGIYNNEDVKDMLAVLELYNTETTKDIYDWGCNKLLPVKLAKTMKERDDRYAGVPEWSARELRRLVAED